MPLVVTVLLIARNTVLSVAPDVTVHRALAMDALIGLIADSINTNTAQKTHKWIIVQPLLIPDRG